jgi:hypothetical protein
LFLGISDLLQRWDLFNSDVGNTAFLELFIDAPYGLSLPEVGAEISFRDWNIGWVLRVFIPVETLSLIIKESNTIRLSPAVSPCITNIYSGLLEPPLGGQFQNKTLIRLSNSYSFGICSLDEIS